MAQSNRAIWPELPYLAWQDTRKTVHLWTPIVGKVRLEQTPWLNHSWHVPLYVTARGLSTSLIANGSRSFEIEFDFSEHVLEIAVNDGSVEINSSFYRVHATSTYARWAKQAPRAFRFAVKVPRQITHDQRLRTARRPLEQFLGNVGGLGRRLGPLVVQLPPSLGFERRIARGFLALLRKLHDGPVACEPRHASWFEPDVDALLLSYRIGRVAADPAVVPAAALPGGWPGIVYYRLHGSPRKYWSIYEVERLAEWARALKTLPRSTPAWCVLDNTAGGGAVGNALQLLEMAESPHCAGRRVS